MITLTRRYQFSASHRLRSPALSEAQNARLYGKCNNPFGHGHNYVLEVTAAGRVDDRTGLLLPLAKLDRLVEETVLRLFSFRNINADVPQFAHLVPTTENVTRVIAQLLEENWQAYLSDTQAHLHRIQIQETRRNGFELFLHTPRNAAEPNLQIESVTVHA